MFYQMENISLPTESWSTWDGIASLGTSVLVAPLIDIVMLTLQSRIVTLPNKIINCLGFMDSIIRMQTVFQMSGHCVTELPTDIFQEIPDWLELSNKLVLA